MPELTLQDAFEKRISLLEDLLKMLMDRQLKVDLHEDGPSEDIELREAFRNQVRVIPSPS